MSASDMEELTLRIRPKIVKMDTKMRPAIPVKERLAVTLRFLATGKMRSERLGFYFFLFSFNCHIQMDE